MAIRKIDLMHRQFGICPGHKCKYCDNLIVRHRDRRYYKCEVYGISNSEATDWCLSYDACGMYNKVWGGNPLIRMVKPERPMEEAIDGQKTFFEEEP